MIAILVARKVCEGNQFEKKRFCTLVPVSYLAIYWKYFLTEEEGGGLFDDTSPFYGKNHVCVLSSYFSLTKYFFTIKII